MPYAATSHSPVLDALIAGMGLPATLKLAAWRGGMRLYVPNPMPPDHELVQRLGHEAAQWLSREFAGTKLMVPKASAYLRAARNARMREQHAAGVSIRQLCQQEGLYESQVCRILAGSTAEPKQMGLW